MDHPHPHPQYPPRPPARTPMPGQMVAVVVLMAVGTFFGLCLAFLYGGTTVEAALDEEARRDFHDSPGRTGEPGAGFFVQTVAFALMGLAYSAASLTMIVRAWHRGPSTPRAIVAVQALAFLSLPLSGFSFLYGIASLVHTAVLGLYCAAITLLVLSPPARRYYRPEAWPDRPVPWA